MREYYLVLICQTQKKKIKKGGVTTASAVSMRKDILVEYQDTNNFSDKNNKGNLSKSYHTLSDISSRRNLN